MNDKMEAQMRYSARSLPKPEWLVTAIDAKGIERQIYVLAVTATEARLKVTSPGVTVTSVALHG